MGLFSLEHGKVTYAADFVLYGISICTLTLTLLLITPSTQWLATIGLVLLGLAAWSVAEYALHRFVLHGLEPFKSWHIAHHLRPAALMGTPTVLSATAFVLLAFLPAWWAAGVQRACAFTIGLLMGYLAYSLMHHALHHTMHPWPMLRNWLRHRKHWHARHHQSGKPCCYGVTSSLWDHVFASVQTQKTPRHTTKS